MAPHDERTWGMWAHLGALLAIVVTGFLGWLPPLLIMQTRGQESAFVRREAVESLNFQLTLIIGGIGAAIIGTILFVVLIWTIIVPILIFIAWLAIGIGALVFMIMGSVGANRGEPYRYPVNFRMIS